MSEELDRRAAKAMGWTWVGDRIFPFWETGEVARYHWSPSTDRNDLAELLKEVERRGLVLRFAMKVDNAWIEGGGNLPRYIVWLLTADPAIICEAACEVLEAR